MDLETTSRFRERLMYRELRARPTMFSNSRGIIYSAPPIPDETDSDDPQPDADANPVEADADPVEAEANWSGAVSADD